MQPRHKYRCVVADPYRYRFPGAGAPTLTVCFGCMSASQVAALVKRLGRLVPAMRAAGVTFLQHHTDGCGLHLVADHHVAPFVFVAPDSPLHPRVDELTFMRASEFLNFLMGKFPMDLFVTADDDPCPGDCPSHKRLLEFLARKFPLDRFDCGQTLPPVGHRPHRAPLRPPHHF